MDNQNAIAVYEEQGLIADLTSATSIFSSVKADTPEEKALLFNAMNNPAHRLADCINKTIKITDLYCETVTTVNKETGEAGLSPRIVMIDDQGVGYVAVSKGIYNAVKKVITLFGLPTWSPAIPIEIKQVSKGQNKILTFDVKVK